MIKVSKNREKFFVCIVTSLTLFIIGLMYILIPTYYGTDNMLGIDVNNLFLIIMLVIALLKFAEYFVNGDNPNKEAIFVSMATCVSGIVNTYLTSKLSSSYSLSISMFVCIFLLSLVKIFTIDYYHDRKDPYFAVELMFFLILFIVGVAISFSMFSDPILQTIELGFIVILYSIIGMFNATLKTLIKSKRVLKKLKVM